MKFPFQMGNTGFMGWDKRAYTRVVLVVAMQNVDEKEAFDNWVSPGVAYLQSSSSTSGEFAPALTLVNSVG
jgi:hypothetical protein